MGNGMTMERLLTIIWIATVMLQSCSVRGQGQKEICFADPTVYVENGKYYSQDGVTYLCTRDTGTPVYNPLADLVGIYVEEAA